MKKLLLFDVDNTLITSVHDNRFERAIRNLHGLETKLEGDFQGYTDYLILAALLKSEGWSEAQIEETMPNLFTELDSVHASTFKPDNIKVLPGVENFLKTLKAKGYLLGLITGNLEIIAERKLAAVDLWKFFELGGYGSDKHATRADLVSIATNRAGYSDKLEDVYAFGDTARDIQAARDAGIENSVGVTNGFRDKQELINAKAKFVFEDFVNVGQLLAELGI